MKINILILLISFVLASCELTKEIDYETIYGKDKFIIHGFISPQQGVQILVKKTIPPNKVSANDKVENVIVTLYENEIAIEELQQIDDYIFTSDTNFSPNPNKKYSIKISGPLLDDVYSTPQPLFATIPIDSAKIIKDENTNYKNCVVWFNNSYKYDIGAYLKLFYYYNDTIVPSGNREIFNPFGLEKLVLGENFIEYPLYEDFDSLKIELYTLSPDLTAFLTSIQNYTASKDDPFFEQPYPVYSNINNGYGIFASYSVYSTIIKNK